MLRGAKISKNNEFSFKKKQILTSAVKIYGFKNIDRNNWLHLNHCKEKYYDITYIILFVLRHRQQQQTIPVLVKDYSLNRKCTYCKFQSIAWNFKTKMKKYY